MKNIHKSLISLILVTCFAFMASLNVLASSGEWSALGSGVNNSVNSIATDANGYVYAGGHFTSAGGVSANRIARWDGTSWSALGSGMGWGVRSIAIDSDYVYAGGWFTTAGGESAN
jgi:hypothetical protein